MKLYPALSFFVTVAFCYPLFAATASKTTHHPAVSAKKATKKPLATKLVAVPSLTPVQTTAAKSALKSLRKLGAATAIGVTASEYRNRLIDTKADVDENLRSLPNGKVKDDIAGSLQAYEDASTFWNECSEVQGRKKIKEGVSGPILAKYKLTLLDQGTKEAADTEQDIAQCAQENAAAKKILDDPNGNTDDAQPHMDKAKELLEASLKDLGASFEINDDDRKMILSAIWHKADEQIQDADTAIKESE